MRLRALTLSAIIGVFFALPVSLASAALTSDACSSLSPQDRANNAVCSTATPKTDPVIHVIHVTADIFALMAGVAAVILIIAGGIGLITSRGNTDAVGNAKKRITNAVIGLAIIAFAWTIITFATDKLIK